MSATAGPVRLPRPVAGAAAPHGAGQRLRGRLGLLRHPGCVLGYVQGKAFRRRYAASLTLHATSGPVLATPVGAAVCSFSSERDLPEQVASIRSFLRYAGTPSSWTVFSDGSHTPASRDLLRSIHPLVRVLEWDSVVAKDLPSPVRLAVDRHPLGKKLALLMSLPVDGPTIVVDSDVLFFPGAQTLAVDVSAGPGIPRYQLDCYNVLDERLVGPQEAAAPTNTGFLVLHRALDWDRAVRAVTPLSAASDFFSSDAAWIEQGMAHLALCDSGARPLDPARFVIRGDDYLRYREHGPRDTWVMRHYAGPTRYMLWVRLMNDRRHV